MMRDTEVRAARLAEQLRANLRRRKEQARAAEVADRRPEAPEADKRGDGD